MGTAKDLDMSLGPQSTRAVGAASPPSAELVDALRDALVVKDMIIADLHAALKLQREQTGFAQTAAERSTGVAERMSALLLAGTEIDAQTGTEGVSGDVTDDTGAAPFLGGEPFPTS